MKGKLKRRKIHFAFERGPTNCGRPTLGAAPHDHSGGRGNRWNTSTSGPLPGNIRVTAFPDFRCSFFGDSQDHEKRPDR